jgi:hypothetical protein
MGQTVEASLFGMLRTGAGRVTSTAPSISKIVRYAVAPTVEVIGRWSDTPVPHLIRDNMPLAHVSLETTASVAIRFGTGNDSQLMIWPRDAGLVYNFMDLTVAPRKTLLASTPLLGPTARARARLALCMLCCLQSQASWPCGSTTGHGKLRKANKALPLDSRVMLVISISVHARA